MRWTGVGNASASSCEMLMNSTVSRAPVSSVALAPGALYLRRTESVLVSAVMSYWGIDVPKGHAIVTLLELQLLFEGQVHGLGAHGKHLVYKFIRTMILQTVIIVSGIEQGKSSGAYSLPEAKSGGSFPKLVSLTDIAGLDELVVDN